MFRIREFLERILISCLPKPGGGGGSELPRGAFRWALLILLGVVGRTDADHQRQTDEHQRLMETMTAEVRMKAIGIAFQMYASEADGERWPNLVPGTDLWVPGIAKLYNEYFMDPNFLVSPSHPDCSQLVANIRACFDSRKSEVGDAEPLVAESFAYLGYEVHDEGDFEALCQARAGGGLSTADGAECTTLRPLRGFTGDDPTSDPDSGTTTAKTRSKTPVLVEIARYKHRSAQGGFDGCDVLYQDGHVDHVPLGSFPVLPGVMDVLSGTVS
jgi:hypothetical protein